MLTEAADRRDPWNRWDSQRRDRDQRGVVRVRVDVVGLGRDLQGVLLGDAVAERVANNCRVREAERDDDAGHLVHVFKEKLALVQGFSFRKRVDA